jgi:hypothetical protein
VILLMFGVGLHFSLKDLLSVKNIAIPGAVAQIAIATLLGMGLGWLLGWPVGEGFLFGLALSVASTVVLLKALQERRWWRPSAAASPWAGSSSRTSPWCWRWCSFLRSPASSVARARRSRAMPCC